MVSVLTVPTNIESGHTVGKRNYILGCNALNIIVIKLSICRLQTGIKICAAIGLETINSRFNSIVSGYRRNILPLASNTRACAKAYNGNIATQAVICVFFQAGYRVAIKLSSAIAKDKVICCILCSL